MWLWRSDSLSARFARFALAPAALVYRAGASIRSRRIQVQVPALPTISVGNLTVGGTGKTPIAAWIVGELQSLGAKPAVILRGYSGGDEVEVHRHLNPGVPVIANPDRLAGAREAKARGADVAVLDDAFQHRRIARVSDIVLLSADAWDGDVGRIRLLPAGPWREPLSALRRASAVIVTRKAADESRVDAVTRTVASYDLPTAVAHLTLGNLRTLAGEEKALDTLRDTAVLAIAGIGDSEAFFAQLRAVGARVTPRAFRDHHAFTRADADQLARAAAGAPVVCTLKDAVKLEREWPRGVGPLWYVSQRVEFDRGREALVASLGAAYRTSFSTGFYGYRPSTSHP
ncbi:MAG TPA: tetraacyldisaccharide 4'-kinase [Gemmatimonadaceae bacterium]|nr:tetraacyldisaccharide 4'-kinase [Gemmatimonadaceae bacterium]